MASNLVVPAVPLGLCGGIQPVAGCLNPKEEAQNSSSRRRAAYNNNNDTSSPNSINNTNNTRNTGTVAANPHTFNP